MSPLTLADLDWFHQLNTNSFVRHYLWDDEIISKDRAHDLLTTVASSFENNGWGLWKVTSRTDHELLGYAGLWPFFDEAKPQLLYAFHPDWTGSGYATESSQRIAAYAFEQLGFSDLVASMDAENHASAKVCERLGMTFKGAREIDGAHVRFYVLTHSPTG